MSSLTGCFIDSDLFDIGVVSLISCFIYMMLDKSPQAGIMLGNQFGNSFYRHGRRQKHDIGFKQQSESAAFSGPGNIDHSDTAVTALDTGDPSVHVSFMLEKIQMSPGFLVSVMDRTVCSSTVRTEKSASLGKVQINIQTFMVNIKLTLRNLPWGCQHQRNLDEFCFFHDRKTNTIKTRFQPGYPLDTARSHLGSSLFRVANTYDVPTSCIVILFATSDDLKMLNNTIRILKDGRTQEYMQESITFQIWF